MSNPRPSPLARPLACALACGAALWLTQAGAVSLADRAHESGCTTKPVSMSGALYKCTTRTGAEAFFNVPDGRSESAPSSARSAPTPSSFPRVDSDTQKSRDEMRRKVLGDELATEEKLRADTRSEYGNGAPRRWPKRRPTPSATGNASSGCARASSCTSATSTRSRRNSAAEPRRGATPAPHATLRSSRKRRLGVLPRAMFVPRTGLAALPACPPCAP